MDFLRRATGRGPAETIEVNPLEIARQASMPKADPATADPRVLHFNDGTTFEGSSATGRLNPAFGNEAALRERYPAADREPFDEEGIGPEEEEGLEEPLGIPIAEPRAALEASMSTAESAHAQEKLMHTVVGALKAVPVLEATTAAALLAAIARSGDEEETEDDRVYNATQVAVETGMGTAELTAAPEKLMHTIVEAVVEGSPAALEALSQTLLSATGGVIGLGEMAIMLHEYADVKREGQHLEHLLKECQAKRKANPGDRDLESLEKCLGYAADQLNKKSNRLKVKLASTLGQLTGAAVSLAGGGAGAAIIVTATGAKSTVPLYQVGRSVYKRLAGTRGEMRTMFARGVFELARVDHGTRNPDAQRMATELLGLAGAEGSSQNDTLKKLKKFASSMG